MKKSVFAIALLVSMFTMPMSMNASGLSTTQAEYDFHHPHGDYRMHERVDEIVNTLRHTTFDSDKKNVAKRALRLRPVDAYGIRRIVECFTFDSDKKEILKYAIPFCVNLEDYYTAVNALTFSSDKEDVMRAVDNYIDSYYRY